MGSGDMNNYIHPSAIVSARAIIGMNNYIGPYCVIHDNTIIGSNNTFISHVSVGSPAEHRNEKYHPEYNPDCFVYIGDNNTFREFVTINLPTESKRTEIRSNCYLMKGSHVGHDAYLEDYVTLACNSLVGGHVYIMRGASIGLGAAIHQRQIIGAYSMLGMNSTVDKKCLIEPFKTYVGSPAKYIHDNNFAIEKYSLTESNIKNELNRFNILRGAH